MLVRAPYDASQMLMHTDGMSSGRFCAVAYRFAIERGDYSAFASGQVLYSAPGYTAFPVRLANEVAQRCFALLGSLGVSAPYTLYDPCCGSAQLLTILAYLHGDQLRAIRASDSDSQAIRFAERNLALLTLSGLDMRIAEIASLTQRFGKASHAEALVHAAGLRDHLVAMQTAGALSVHVFRADASSGDDLRAHLGSDRVDLVVTDVPYGRQTAWQSGMEQDPNVLAGSRLLAALHPILQVQSVVAVAANRQQAIQHPAYRRVDYLRIGKRHITFLTPVRRERDLHN